MADITDAEAIRFCNERVRMAANVMAQAYYFAKLVKQEWDANSMSSLITNSGDDEVVDGAQTDGRHVISGADATNVITRCAELITDMEASSNAKLNTLLGVATNPQRSM